MTEAEHGNLKDKVQSAEVRNSAWLFQWNFIGVPYKYLFVVGSLLSTTVHLPMAERISSTRLMAAMNGSSCSNICEMKTDKTVWFLQPPVYCLMATVKEAKGILGKDVSGEFAVLPLRTLRWLVLILIHPVKPNQQRVSRDGNSSQLIALFIPIKYVNNYGCHTHDL